LQNFSYDTRPGYPFVAGEHRFLLKLSRLSHRRNLLQLSIISDIAVKMCSHLEIPLDPKLRPYGVIEIDIKPLYYLRQAGYVL